LYLARVMMHVVINASPDYRGSTGNDGLYTDTLSELDAETGRPLKMFNHLGLRDGTVVLFTSDNGPWSNGDARQGATNAKHVGWTDGPKVAWGPFGPLRGDKGTTREGEDPRSRRRALARPRQPANRALPSRA
jgi:hypothetical protein